MFNVNLFPKKIKSLKNHERYIVCSLKKEPHLSVPSSSFSSPPGSNLSSQKYAQEKLVVSNPTFFSAFLRVSNKKLCPVFSNWKRRKNMQRPGRTLNLWNIICEYLWFSKKYIEIREIIKTCSSLIPPTKRASKAFDTPMLLTQWPLLTHFLAEPLENRSIHDVRFFGVKNINQPYLSERGWIPMNVSFQVFTGKLWFKSFHWKIRVDFLCFISCVFWWIASGCLIKDRRIQLKKPFLLTGAEGEFASSLLCRKCPKKWDFSPFSVLLSKLSCPACLSKLNDSNLLTSQRDSSTSFPPLRHFLHHPHPPGSESRFERFLGTSQKKKP